MGKYSLFYRVPRLSRLKSGFSEAVVGIWTTRVLAHGLAAGLTAVMVLGMTGDIPVTGDWDGTGIMRLGVFRNGWWYLDINGNGAWDPGVDLAIPFGMTGDLPVVGNWNGSADGKSKVGVFRNGTWYLDYPGTGAWVGCGATPDTDRCYTFGMAGDIPVVGDWSGNGTPKIGVFRNGTWYLDYPGTGRGLAAEQQLIRIAVTPLVWQEISLLLATGT